MRHRKSPTGGRNTRRAKAKNITIIINKKGGIVNMRDVTSTTWFSNLVHTGYADRQYPSFCCEDCETYLSDSDKIYVAGRVGSDHVIGCEHCITVETRQDLEDMDIHVFVCPCCGETIDDYDKVYMRDCKVVSCESCTETVTADEYFD